MARFILSGDLTKAARVVVEADNKEQAIEKAEKGDFAIYDEVNKGMEFKFDGDDDHIEQEDQEEAVRKA